MNDVWSVGVGGLIQNSPRDDEPLIQVRPEWRCPETYKLVIFSSTGESYYLPNFRSLEEAKSAPQAFLKRTADVRLRPVGPGRFALDGLIGELEITLIKFAKGDWHFRRRENGRITWSKSFPSWEDALTVVLMEYFESKGRALPEGYTWEIVDDVPDSF